jgi:hypothetical protein
MSGFNYPLRGGKCVRCATILPLSPDYLIHIWFPINQQSDQHIGCSDQIHALRGRHKSVRFHFGRCGAQSRARHDHEFDDSRGKIVQQKSLQIEAEHVDRPFLRLQLRI